MLRLLLRTKARIRDALKPAGEAAVGALTIGMLVWTKLKRGPNPEIPYGVAIAFAGLWLIGERFLNQFG